MTITVKNGYFLFNNKKNDYLTSDNITKQSWFIISNIKTNSDINIDNIKYINKMSQLYINTQLYNCTYSPDIMNKLELMQK